MKHMHTLAHAVLLGSLGLAAGAAHAQADLSSASIFSSGYAFEQQDGAALYRAACQSCHMADARGATGAGTYPALAANPRLAAKQYPALMVLKGAGAMPVLGRSLSDEQVAAVVNYLRSHFGNAYPDRLSAADVKALRP